jgi:transposase
MTVCGLGASIDAPEYILRALLLQVFYSVRSEPLLVEQIEYNLLFRWFVGLGINDACGTTRCSRKKPTTGCRPAM